MSNQGKSTAPVLTSGRSSIDSVLKFFLKIFLPKNVSELVKQAVRQARLLIAVSLCLSLCPQLGSAPKQVYYLLINILMIRFSIIGEERTWVGSRSATQHLKCHNVKHVLCIVGCTMAMTREQITIYNENWLRWVVCCRSHLYEVLCS